MLAREIAEEFPVVDVDSDALEAARLLAAHRLPGLVVTRGARREPVAVLPGSQVLRFLIPGYIQEDPTLARVLDEPHADQISARLRGKRVGDLLPEERRELPIVGGDDQVVEIAAVMAKLRSPLAVVVDEGRIAGVVTVARLLDKILPAT